MPEKTQVIGSGGNDADTLQALTYGAMELLQWDIKYAAEHLLIAYTPRKWNKWDDEVTVSTKENELTVTSKLVHNESFDLSGKNKKHLAAFEAAFEKIRSVATAEQLSEWKIKIEALVNKTIAIAEEEIQKANEADKVMNFSTGNMYVTYAIIAINILIFIAMAVQGVGIITPDTIAVIKWGANLAPLTLGGEWWRLLSSVFLHFGILHLLLNMYALYFIGSYLEPMLGKVRYIAAYLCAGLLASLISVIWHKDVLVPSAGASGAIFGMFGVFLALLTTSIIPKHVKNALLQSVLIFVGFNVFYGFKPNSGIDNAAHLGGLISGMVIGYIYYFSFKQPTVKKAYVFSGVITAATIVILAVILNKEKTPPKEMDYTSGQIYNKGEGKFGAKKMELAALEEKALAVYKDANTQEPEKLSGELETITLPAWNEAQAIAMELEQMAVSAAQKQTATILLQYVDLRIRLSKLQIKALKENTADYDKEITSLVEQINTLVEDLKKIQL